MKPGDLFKHDERTLRVLSTDRRHRCVRVETLALHGVKLASKPRSGYQLELVKHLMKGKKR